MALRHGVLGTLIGFGIAKAVPDDLFPKMGVALRPVAKALIHKGLSLIDSVQELVAEGQEYFSDLVAEVEYERAPKRAEDPEDEAKGDREGKAKAA
ncbi:MAG TPA: hypothetical protein VNN62_05535 [Methylomirabilota bacterium]|jgi:hypothetical protein|nr:hypothetical protein [Methylomirabilota bacterium]